MIYYVPTTQNAYASMQDIQYAVPLGAFMRAMHRWAAHGMVICIFLHFIRVVATAGYRNRELNWLLGLSLGAFSLALAFTGYLLPWDQLSYWAIGVSAAMMDHVPIIGKVIKTLFIGGDSVSQSTLLRFYTLHVALLPAGIAVILGLHLWRIRKDGGLAFALNAAGGKARVPAWPHLVLREVILVLGVLSALSLISLCWQAPLGIPVDPYLPSNPEKAPWYFVGIQEMVSYSATLGGFIYPVILILVLVLLPFLEREDQALGTWLGSVGCRRWVGMTCLIAIVGFVLLEVLYLGDEFASSEIANPVSGMLLLAVVAFFVVGVFSKSTRTAFLVLLMVLLVTLLGCTMVGMCRGPNWTFYWPWEEWLLVS
jgi:quinol-cytochrome oxidoreductase complex cytochrome b subunit